MIKKLIISAHLPVALNCNQWYPGPALYMSNSAVTDEVTYISVKNYAHASLYLSMITKSLLDLDKSQKLG